MIKQEDKIKECSDARSKVKCRKGCDVYVSRHNLARHEEIECTSIPEERREILKQVIQHEVQAVRSEVQSRKNTLLQERNKELKALKLERNKLKLDLKRLENEGNAKEIYDDNIIMATDSSDHSHDEVTVWRFTDMKNMKKVYMSRPFYTHVKGYKMCLFVYPNGYGKAEGKHVSVLVSIMNGENDDSLQWPFRGIITIDLLDQSKSKKKDHRTVTVRYLDNDPAYSNRVYIGTNNAAKGKLWLVAHDSLLGPSNKFLKDDCLRLRVRKIDRDTSERINKRSEFILLLLIFLIIHLFVLLFSCIHK